MLRERGAQEISMEFYRDNFAFPVRPFYTKIGMVLENEAWDDIAQEYHDVYAMQPKRLNRDTIAALETVKKAGLKQSVISALRQDLLNGDMVNYGVGEYFDRVFGVDNLDGASKITRAKSLLAELNADPADIIMIGDSLHDKEVANAIGVKCILTAQGSHAGWRLREVAPTGDTLLEAVELALMAAGLSA
jgi:phosphoglycolate phosphatase